MTVAGLTVAIIRRAGTEQRPIVRLQGVEDRPAAEALRGQALTVRRTRRRRSPRASGGRTSSRAARSWTASVLLGTVIRLIELPSCEALEIERDRGGGSLLVPMVKDAIRRVEPARGRIEVNLDFLEPVEPAPPRLGSPRAGGSS